MFMFINQNCQPTDFSSKIRGLAVPTLQCQHYPDQQQSDCFNSGCQNVPCAEFDRGDSRIDVCHGVARSLANVIKLFQRNLRHLRRNQSKNFIVMEQHILDANAGKQLS
jgi:hypothetical protein